MNDNSGDDPAQLSLGNIIANLPAVRAAKKANTTSRVHRRLIEPIEKMGRPPKLTPHQQKEAIKRRDQGEETLADIAHSYNVSAATISRLTT